MKYLEKYNRYIDNDCVIYRKDKEGKLVQVKPSLNNCGYEFLCYASSRTTTGICSSIVYVHRMVYEAFKGEVPEGMEIDHIDRNKHNNNPDNLRVVTHKENMGNLGTNSIQRQISSDFGKKYFSHFGYSKNVNQKQYDKERWWYRTHHKKCSWEQI